MRLVQVSNYPTAKDLLRGGYDIVVIEQPSLLEKRGFSPQQTLWCHIIVRSSWIAESITSRLGWKPVNPLEGFVCLLAPNQDSGRVAHELQKIFANLELEQYPQCTEGGGHDALRSP